MMQPFGFTNPIEFVRQYILRACRSQSTDLRFCASIGCGDAQPEINIAQWLLEQDCSNFRFECYDGNTDVLERGRALAQEKGFQQYFHFDTFDVNSWKPCRRYAVVVAFQFLHHVLELERLFETIRNMLEPGGHFLTDDMIGRNGHQRWPEALAMIEDLWPDLPVRYKYNHQMGRIIDPYENLDYSKDCFEGIRAQDILPLAAATFHFEVFFAFGNLIDIFIDRGFGHNFDPGNPEDTSFIDRIHALDMQHLEAGNLTPTHMIAAMTREPVARTATYKHLTPAFCQRKTR
jgi:2-polyprenyl-3-methyl-5-hydroxy-6-metoxy-1,4-benzoquinol methylase